MPNGSLSIATYPFDPVRIECKKCDRQGQYRKATLLKTYDPDKPMPDLLNELVKCEHKKKMGGRCDAIYPDLVRK